MRLLLDTHVALWAMMDGPRLSANARSLLVEPDAEPVVSVVSLWEIGIKFALGPQRRNPMPHSAREAHRLFAGAGYRILPMTAAHTAAIDDLPPHHGDPFDRMLVAQATCESIRLLTADKRLAAYGAMVVTA